MFMQRPNPIIKEVSITLEQCFNGCNFQIDIDRSVIKNNVQIIENESIYINIPPGIDSNEQIIINDKGNRINDMNGEIRLHIKVTNETEFKRNGLDLTMNKKVTLKECLCGFSFEISHLNGKRLCLSNKTNPTIVYPNYKKVIPNMGMKKGNSVGDLNIVFEVIFPESLTPEQISKISEIL
jgi:DnaJ-class molecular chaperone